MFAVVVAAVIVVVDFLLLLFSFLSVFVCIFLSCLVKRDGKIDRIFCENIFYP